MPTYEYACTACGHHVEVVQSFHDHPLTECPECGGALKKVFGSIGIVLKGSGFYKTDSRTTGPKGAKSEGGHGDGASSSKSDAPASSGTSEGGSSAAGGASADSKGSGGSAGSGSAGSGADSKRSSSTPSPAAAS
jgi:putative FmdB family regulatory protein